MNKVFSHYYHVSYFSTSYPLHLTRLLIDFFFQLYHLYFLPYPVLVIIWILTTTLIVIGFFTQVIRRGFKRTEGYILAYLLLLLFTSAVHIRYLLPIGPFLFSYLFSGVAFITPQGKTFYKLKIPFIVLLACYYLIYDTRLILFGNGRDYGGLNILMSPTAEKFYRGRWKDLYELSFLLKKDPFLPGDVGLLDISESTYIQYFSGRLAEDYFKDKKFTYLMANQNIDPKTVEEISQDWVLEKETPSLRLYRRK